MGQSHQLEILIWPEKKIGRKLKICMIEKFCSIIFIILPNIRSIG